MMTCQIMETARLLALPEPVLGPLERAAGALPEDLPLAALAAPDTAESAWEAVSARLPGEEEDDGMAHLAASLAAAGHTRRLYRENGVGEDVYRATMGCFARFLRETREIAGRWRYDRAFWTWRQTGGLLFRLGALEYEYCVWEGEALPPGLERGAPVLSVHIPSDASLTREALDQSYAQAERFFAGEGRRFCRGGAPGAVLCGSWLLARPGRSCCRRTPASGALPGLTGASPSGRTTRSFTAGCSARCIPCPSAICRSAPAFSGRPGPVWPPAERSVWPAAY